MLLETVDNIVEAEVLRQILEDAGVPCMLQNAIRAERLTRPAVFARSARYLVTEDVRERARGTRRVTRLRGLGLPPASVRLPAACQRSGILYGVTGLPRHRGDWKDWESGARERGPARARRGHAQEEPRRESPP